MSVLLTEEQRMIQDMAREFARTVVAPGAAERDRQARFPADVLRQMGSLGFMGMMVPVAYGGSGTDAVGYVSALAEIAGACASTAVVMSVQNSIVCESLLAFGTEEQKERFLTPLASGQIIGAFAMTEPEAGSDPLRQKTTARRDGESYIINGTKRFITSGEHAGIVLVTAKTDPAARHRGVSIFVVPKGTPGFEVGRREEKMGLRASDTTDLVFTECRVPADHRLGEEGQGFHIAMRGLDSGRIGIAAQSVGVGQAALDAALSYIREREQFGRNIAAFQGVRWMAADMAVDVAAAWNLTLAAAVMKDRGGPYTSEAAMAKLYASEMVNRVTADAVQLHGGYGYTTEYPVERYYRDVRVFTIYEGTSEIQRVVIANHLLGDRSTI